MKKKTTLSGSEPKSPENAAQGEIHQVDFRPEPALNRGERYLLMGAWLIALSLVLFAFFLARNIQAGKPPFSTNSFSMASSSVQAAAPLAEQNQSLATASSLANLPPLSDEGVFQALSRRTILHTIIPTRPRQDTITYTVGLGDSVFGIAQKYNIKPETVLWANYDTLKDSPDMLSPNMDLRIPPVDGVFYKWEEGDTFEGVAAEFKAEVDDILGWSGNQIDLTSPRAEPGQEIMVVGGQREFVQWVVPTIPRGAAGVSKSVYGPGACEGGYEGAYGTGFFVWPMSNHALSGNDYWSGHLAIDIAAGIGDGVFAADSGVVVFAGWSTGGYGYMVMIDHGNGYQTVYGHLSQVSARCGQSVSQGQYIAGAGSTGNSTGPHLHFEVRYLGGFLNPWHVLPAP